MSIGPWIVVAVSLQKVNDTPDRKAGSNGYH